MTDITKKAVGELDNVASALRRAGSELGDANGVAGKLVSAVADRVESAGRSLDGRELGDLVGDVERFARRNPATFIGGAIAVGFLASRFLKSSSQAVPPRAERTDTPNDLDASQITAGGIAGFDTGSTVGYAGGASSFAEPQPESMLDRPLIAGLAALAVGAIAGAIIHETDREHQLFGTARDRLLESARTAARERVAQTVATVTGRE